MLHRHPQFNLSRPCFQQSLDLKMPPSLYRVWPDRSQGCWCTVSCILLPIQLKGPLYLELSLLMVLEMHRPFPGQLAGERVSLNTYMFFRSLSRPSHITDSFLCSNYELLQLQNCKEEYVIEQELRSSHGPCKKIKQQQQNNKTSNNCLRCWITTKPVLSFICMSGRKNWPEAYSDQFILFLSIIWCWGYSSTRYY